MSLTCQLSGTVPVEPVVDPQGHFFEKRLIEEQLEKSGGRCPLGGETVDKANLIQIAQAPVRAPISPVYNCDFGSLVRGIQERYDALAIECERLRTERNEARTTITQSLYLRDAATALLAAKVERIEALEKQLARVQEQIAESGEGDVDAGRRKKPRLDESESFDGVLAQWTPLSQALLQNRKKRVVQHRSFEDMKKYHLVTSQQTSIKDSTSLVVVLSGRKPTTAEAESNPAAPYLLAIGGADGQIEVRDIVQNRSVATLSGHDGSVTSMLSVVHPSVSHVPQSALFALGASSSSSKPFRSCLNIVSGDSSGIINIWRETSCKAMDDIEWMMDYQTPFGSEKCANLDALPSALQFSNQIIETRQGAIKNLKLHPSGTHIAAVSASRWSMLSLISGAVSRAFDDAPTPISDVAFQPDGLVVIGAGRGTLPVWDFRQASMKTQCRAPEKDANSEFTSVNFSEAGYYMVTATANGRGHLWDLRKTAVLQEYELGAKVLKARFDYSGHHIVFSTTKGAVLFSTKEKKNVVMVQDWEQGHEVVDSHFALLNDDYMVSLRGLGIVDVMQP
eukprot:Protomagalhaensia_sp_Gyna_25__300@NODE_113_length_5155_cov_105_540070_g89_i0_p1_GENE_NODE_113_length_5155_cov_105_540070_g89_i0NODE_113_length_5155_cov_105_540070_g89_i0_p1_ORF_typecomplete_len565_score83_75ANAPC4_WD40/PF12894_7/0_0071ANAPC4_WD40/PF12894_7/1ANAPC4_WD40/PF12894_7/0_21ANAPC4_WD40/PF12894_7/3e05ANAPC4_WD40/PF12894_7/8_3e02eIF2A/PF08662_11/1_2e03eIF2A/PF08662_11/6_9e02eIF2A/PF08662_11/3_2e05eIF2A/PF08662_11/1_9e05Ubox/PF04564_15/5_2e07WD40_like/PF17005_5/1WD40_like/PF17005_5/0_0041W